MNKTIKIWIIVAAACLLLLAVVFGGVFLLLRYGNQTDAFLTYQEHEVTYDLVKTVVEVEDLHHDQGYYRHGGQSVDYYYHLGSISPEEAVIVKKVRGDSESYAILYQVETVEDPYAFFAPESATLFPAYTEEENAMVSFTSRDEKLLSTFWTAFLAADVISLDCEMQAVSWKNDAESHVVLRLSGIDFTLYTVDGALLWCAENWNGEKGWLVPYDAETFDSYLTLYRELPVAGGYHE